MENNGCINNNHANDCIEFKSMYELVDDSPYIQARRKQDQEERLERQSRIVALMQIPLPTERPKRSNFNTEEEYLGACQDYGRSIGLHLGYATFIRLDGEVHLYPAWLADLIVTSHRLAVESGKAPILERDGEIGWCRVLPAVLEALKPLLDLPCELADEYGFQGDYAEYPLVRDVLGYGFDVYVYYLRQVDPVTPAGSSVVYRSVIIGS